MIFKSYILEQSFQSIKDCKLFLFYGENYGLKKEFKERIKINTKSYETINLNQDEIIDNKNILINEVVNKSLFNDKKIVFINQANDKILNILEEIIEDIKDDRIFLFSDILDKKSKLRSFFEKSEFNGAVACYKDNDITIRKIISKKLNNYKGLNSEIINLIIQNTALDRIKVENEINKIISCFTDKVIDSKKIKMLLNIKTNDDFNYLRDETLKGNKVKTNRLLADTVFELENNIFYLNAINQRLNKINDIISHQNNNSNLESVIANLKPPVFWKDKPIIIEQSKKWNKTKIKEALNKTYNAEIAIKSNSFINKDLIIKNLIIDLCSVASVS
jgi:DNA polymerase-3 subunit delta